MSYDNILIPVDGSSDSALACKAAADLLRLLPGEKTVHLLYCHPNASGLRPARPMGRQPGDSAGRQPGEEDPRLRDLAEPYFAYAREELAGLEHLRVQTVIVHGDPGRTIAEEARERNCALIAMGTRGGGEIRGLVLGSVSHDVIRHSTVPILLVRDPAGEHSAI